MTVLTAFAHMLFFLRKLHTCYGAAILQNRNIKVIDYGLFVFVLVFAFALFYLVLFCFVFSLIFLPQSLLSYYVSFDKSSSIFFPCFFDKSFSSSIFHASKKSNINQYVIN